MVATLMNQLSLTADRWWWWMTEMAWQSALLVAVLLVLDRVFRQSSARFLHAIWLLFLLRMFVPPGIASPTGVAYWLRSEPPLALQSERPPVEEPLAGRPDTVGRGDMVPTNGSTSVGSDTASSIAPRGWASPRARLQALPWRAMLLLSWAAIVAARLGMFSIGWWTVNRWLAASTPIEDDRRLRVWRAACSKVGLRSVPVLRDSQHCVTPLVIGVWRPYVLLPSALADALDDDELESVLVHELTHIRRHDPAIRCCVAITETIYFMFPWVWYAHWRIARLREDACDESTVMALQGRRKPYGSAILKTAELVGYRPPSLALGMRDSHRTPRGRIERLLDAQLPLAPVSSTQTIAVCGLLLLLLFPGGARPAQVSATAEQAVASKAPPRKPSDAHLLDNPSSDRAKTRPATDASLTATRRDSQPRTVDTAPAESSSEESSSAEYSSSASGEITFRPASEVRLTIEEGATIRAATETTEDTEASTIPERVAFTEEDFADSLHDDDWRTMVIEQWATIPQGEVILLRLLDDADWRTRDAALTMLKLVGSSAALPAVERVYLSGSIREQRAAKEALDRIWERARDAQSLKARPKNSELIFD